MAELEFFFDCSSPWTYLAFENIQPIAVRHGVSVTWRPFLVGGIFNTINPTVYAGRANPPPLPKAKYYQKDLKDWAAYTGIAIGAPAVFPVNSVKAMRGALFAQELGVLVPYSRKVFQTYWGELQDISQDDVLARIVTALDIPRDAYFTKIADADYKQRLRANTDELISRGGFGSPSIFIDKTDMYFGNDRLALVEFALAGKPARAGANAAPRSPS